jgi:CRISPR-associated exonuclease Cas4
MLTDPIAISALQHYIFCPRQCALIHVEGLWVESRLTVEGRILHEKAHAERLGPRGGRRHESRPGVRTVRGLALASDRLGLIGKADIVEFHAPDAQDHFMLPGTASPCDADRSAPERAAEADEVDPLAGAFRPRLDAVQLSTPRPKPPRRRRVPLGTPFPIEYKRGQPKKHDADLVQLCAQALCLEEMLALPEGGVSGGAIYYGRTKHRLMVPFTPPLRLRTCEVIAAVRAMIEAQRTPRARREKKCDRCSMIEVCLPDAIDPGRSSLAYLVAAIDQDTGSARA